MESRKPFVSLGGYVTDGHWFHLEHAPCHCSTWKTWVTSPRKRKLYAVVFPSWVPLCWHENIGQLTHSLTQILCTFKDFFQCWISTKNSQPISFRNNQSGFWWWSTINDSYLLANSLFWGPLGGKPKAKILVTQCLATNIGSNPRMLTKYTYWPLNKLISWSSNMCPSLAKGGTNLTEGAQRYSRFGW